MSKRLNCDCRPGRANRIFKKKKEIPPKKGGNSIMQEEIMQIELKYLLELELLYQLALKFVL